MLGKLYLPMFLFQGGTIYPYIQDPLDCFGKVMPLPVYYAEVIHNGEVASGGVVAMYW